MRRSPRPSSVARAGVAAVALGVLSLAGCGGDDDDAATVRTGDVESPSEVLGDADEGIEGVQAIRVFYEPPVHAEDDIDYGLVPPAGGLHNPVPWECGFYDEPVVDENVGHTLEHGAVWISFAPDLADDEVAVIRQLAEQNPSVLAAPYEGLAPAEPVVATAWARQLRLESATDPRLAAFAERYQGGDQAPEAGIGC